jgi:hypothetical protein
VKRPNLNKLKACFVGERLGQRKQVFEVHNHHYNFHQRKLKQIPEREQILLNKFIHPTKLYTTTGHPIHSNKMGGNSANI